jgi:hypothetical protein
LRKVYVAHEFRGKKANKEAIQHICRALVKLGVMPISPIHAFSYLHDNIPEEREKALEFCEELVETCDALFLTGDWQNSHGCHKELKVALLALMPVYEVVGWEGYTPLFLDGDKPKWL